MGIKKEEWRRKSAQERGAEHGERESEELWTRDVHAIPVLEDLLFRRGRSVGI